MAEGAGAYDDLCTYVRETAHAETAVVIVHRGNRGDGFSVQSRDPLHLLKLPAVLRLVADAIERDAKAMGN